jgi:hypothetical protein
MKAASLPARPGRHLDVDNDRRGTKLGKLLPTLEQSLEVERERLPQVSERLVGSVADGDAAGQVRRVRAVARVALLDDHEDVRRRFSSRARVKLLANVPGSARSARTSRTFIRRQGTT